MTETTQENGSARVPRIALAGMSLESNAFAPVATEADFRARYYFEGEEIVSEARRPNSVISSELAAFVATLDATGPWEPVPTVLTDCPPWGPVDHSFLAATVEAIVARLEAAAPLDAVYVANHGAMVSTATPTPTVRFSPVSAPRPDPARQSSRPSICTPTSPSGWSIRLA